MKKSILILILIFLYFWVNAQTKITGLGKLELGSQIAIINELGFKVKTILSTEFGKELELIRNSHSNRAFEFVDDNTEKHSAPNSSLGKLVRLFFIPKLYVSDVIEFESVRLKFFNGKLVEIECDYSGNLIESLTLKYGEPKNGFKEADYVFTDLNTGESVPKKVKEYTSFWQNYDKHIFCTSIILKYLGDDGKEMQDSKVKLSDDTNSAEIQKAEARVTIGTDK